VQTRRVSSSTLRSVVATSAFLDTIIGALSDHFSRED
jgi:hypothetical protein